MSLESPKEAGAYARAGWRGGGGAAGRDPEGGINVDYDQPPGRPAARPTAHTHIHAHKRVGKEVEGGAHEDGLA